MTVTKTSIAWTESTWSPIRGCSRVSTGCEHCYAERQAGRFSGPGQPYERLVRKTSQGFKWTGAVQLVRKDLGAPLHWRKPRRIFVNSMSDLFHEQVEDEWISAIFCIMQAAPQHVFQCLTKRPERLHAFLDRWVHCDNAYGAAAAPWITDTRPSGYGCYRQEGRTRLALPNVWLGVSVENQATADARIPWLLKTPAAVRFVSYEPALGPVNFASLKWPGPGRLDSLTGRFQDDAGRPDDSGMTGLDWLIVGGESGPQARGFDLTWARSVVAQCHAAGVAVFCKQLGTIWAKAHGARDHKGADLQEWPPDLQIQEWPTR